MAKKKWTEEAKLRVRRKRMARRLYKQTPLFAVQEVSERFGIAYTPDDFFADQRLKGDQPPKKRKGKRRRNEKVQYLESLQLKVRRALESKDEPMLQRIMARYYLIAGNKGKPWRIVASFLTGEKIEYFFPLTFDSHTVRKFAEEVDKRVKNGASPDEINTLHDELTKYAFYFG